MFLHHHSLVSASVIVRPSADVGPSENGLGFVPTKRLFKIRVSLLLPKFLSLPLCQRSGKYLRVTSLMYVSFCCYSSHFREGLFYILNLFFSFSSLSGGNTNTCQNRNQEAIETVTGLKPRQCCNCFSFGSHRSGCALAAISGFLLTEFVDVVMVPCCCCSHLGIICVF